MGLMRSFRVPGVPYAAKMKEKSNCMVLAVSNDDCATVYGSTNVLLNMLQYVAPISPCGNVRLRIPVNGDQGYCEKNRKAVDSRTELEDPSQRLSPLLPLAQEWHATKVPARPVLEYLKIMCRKTC